MPAIARVDSTRSARTSFDTIPDSSSSTQPSACAPTPSCARRAAALTRPITDGSATAMVNMFRVSVKSRAAMSVGMERAAGGCGGRPVLPS
jgi:hypothetical protein